MPQSEEEQPTRLVSAFILQSMRSALEQSAALHDRSLSGEIRQALRAYLTDADRGLDRDRIMRVEQSR